MPATILTAAAEAAAALRAGRLVALPTETVYGLGANALDEAAVAAVFAAKKRPSFDPLILHQATADRVLAYAASVPAAARRLAAACWPGPLTLVLPKNPVVPDLVTAGLPTVALRVPDHPLTRAVLAAVDFPVAAPSANPFGFVSPTRADHVLDQLGDRIDHVLDGGPCPVGLESTIVGFPDGRPTVLRKGGLPVEQIEEILDEHVGIMIASSSRPAAPGMLSRHYSPGRPMKLFDAVPKNYSFPAKSAWIRFGGGGRTPAWAAEKGVTVFDLSPTGDLKEAARRLFTVLRLIAAGGYDFVAAERLPESGLGRAINDRLRRAAAR